MHIDPLRREVSAKLDRKQRSALGQFMTPTKVAEFMASLFPATDNCGDIRLLDAGAGIGSLTAAFLERQAHGGSVSTHVEVTTVKGARLD